MTDPVTGQTTASTAPKAASSRQRIIAQGLALFSARGFNGVSMSDIAQAVGITKAALYYHFADKEALFIEVIRTRTADLATHLEQILAEPADLETLLTDVAQFLLDDGLGEYRQLQGDLLTVVDADRRKESLKQMHDLLYQLVPRMREAQANGILAADLDIDMAVRLFFSMIGGQIRRFAMADTDQQPPPSHRDIARLIVRIWLHGAGDSST